MCSGDSSGVLCRAVFVAAMLAIAVVPVAAPQHDGTRSQVAGAIDRLDSPSYAERRAVANALATDTGWASDEAIAAHFRAEAESLTLEQRRQIEQILSRRFFASARGAIGVSMVGRDGARPVLQLVHDGFPAADLDLLRNGDELVVVDGVELGEEQTIAGVLVPAEYVVQALVFSKEPGDVVEMTIERWEQGDDGAATRVRRTLDVPLGSTAGFEESRPGRVRPAPKGLALAWEIRRRQIGIGPLPARAEQARMVRSFIPDAAGPPRRPEPRQRALRELDPLDVPAGGRLSAWVTLWPNGRSQIALDTLGVATRDELQLANEQHRLGLANYLSQASDWQMTAEESLNAVNLLVLLVEHESAECQLILTRDGAISYRIGSATGTPSGAGGVLTIRDVERRLRIIEGTPGDPGTRGALIRLGEIADQRAELRGRIARAQGSPTLRAALERELERLDERAQVLRALVPGR